MDGLTRRSLSLRALWVALASCAILAGGVMLSGGQALAVEGAPPAIDGESVPSITQTGATLEAQINPEGRTVRYQFQVAVSSSQFLAEMACPSEHAAGLCLGSPATVGALPIGFIAASSSDQTVSIDLAGAGVTLAPRTTYQYRVIVVRSPLTEDTIEWEGPPVYGPDQSFTTLATQTSSEGPTPNSQPSIYGPPSSETFTGPGNITPTPTPTPKAKPLTRAQKLTAALKACRKEKGHRHRVACERHARRTYGPFKRKK